MQVLYDFCGNHANILWPTKKWRILGSTKFIKMRHFLDGFFGQFLDPKIIISQFREHFQRDVFYRQNFFIFFQNFEKFPKMHQFLERHFLDGHCCRHLMRERHFNLEKNLFCIDENDQLKMINCTPSFVTSPHRKTDIFVHLKFDFKVNFD